MCCGLLGRGYTSSFHRIHAMYLPIVSRAASLELGLFIISAKVWPVGYQPLQNHNETQKSA